MRKHIRCQACKCTFLDVKTERIEVKPIDETLSPKKKVEQTRVYTEYEEKCVKCGNLVYGYIKKLK